MSFSIRLRGEDLYPKKSLCIILFFIPVVIFAQDERWVYRYSGISSYQNDRSNSICYGGDDNIYAAGVSYNSGTKNDFTVISLTNAGIERWVYNYNGVGDRWDEAHAVIWGLDNNVYAAGDCYALHGFDTTYDFTVISLTPSGAERWVYQYNGPGNGHDYAYSISYGNDNNIYAVGHSWGTTTNFDITIISLTNSGAERWVYRYNGPGDYYDYGYSITSGFDGNIYCAGVSYGSGTYDDFTVLSLDSLGTERWVYRYDGPANYYDGAASVVYSPDGKIYAIGSSYAATSDATVLCLTDSGTVNWLYRSPINYTDDGGRGILGDDGNIYIAGGVGSDTPEFLVISVSDSGTHNWEYIYHTPQWGAQYANAIVYGNDNNLYAAGGTIDSFWEYNFTVISLADVGAERWIYKYHNWGGGYAFSIVYGIDGNIYVAGETGDSITGNDFTVISLSSEPGVNEVNKIGKPASLDLMITPSVVYQKAQLHIHIPTQQNIDLKVYDITGREILTEARGNIIAGKYTYNLDIKKLSSGIYFVKLKGAYEERTKKILVVK